MKESHPDLHPHLADAWNEYIRREHLWATDPTNSRAARDARKAFEEYDRQRRELFNLLHPEDEKP
ncbi:MAG TPA: hypothetical protein VKA32_00545 [Gammaproteobacteria bacterium]|nr:hypothetical protein [Gammaproteobacteria bacterium]